MNGMYFISFIILVVAFDLSVSVGLVILTTGTK